MAIQSQYPNIEPTLNLNFAGTKTLDPRITFSRPSPQTYYDAQGVLRTAPANVPVFDHDPITGESLGYVGYERRTNLAYPSNMPTSTTQTVTGVMLANGATQITAGVPAPDGTLSGFTVSGTTSGTNENGANNVRALAVLATAGTYSVSMWIKTNSATGVAANVNIREPSSSTANTFTTTSTWTRITAVLTSVSTNQNIIIWSTDGAAFDCFGVQIEAGSFPTAYIKTEGSQVTRAASVMIMTGGNFSSWYRQDRGTFVVDMTSPPALTATEVFAAASSGSASNRIQMTTSSVLAGVGITTGGVHQISNVGEAPAANTRYRFAFAYAENNAALSINGLPVRTDTSVALPTCDRFNIGSGATSATTFNGPIRSIQYYPQHFGAQLQALSRS